MARGKFQHELGLIRSRKKAKRAHFKEVAKKKAAATLRLKKETRKCQPPQS